MAAAWAADRHEWRGGRSVRRCDLACLSHHDRLSAGDGLNFGFIQPTKATEREGKAALALRDRFHLQVRQIALHVSFGHYAQIHIRAPGTVVALHLDAEMSSGFGDINVIDGHLVKVAELIGRVLFGVQGEFPVQGDVIKRAGEGIQPDGLADFLVVIDPLLRGKFGKVALK